MKKFAPGVIVALVCIIGGEYAYFAGGFAPVATASRPLQFESKLAPRALNATLKREIPKTVPIEANEADYLAGADEYLIDTFSHLSLGHIYSDWILFS
ncbi:MAG: hypothetical protein ABSF46_30990 [Terriglobia bacterium]|jgi:hypothetical protein